MKITKLTLLAATTAIISSGVANADLMDMEQFYLKAAVGANMMKKTKLNDVKLKSKTAPVINLAAGYSVMENVRGELELGYVINPKLRKNVNGTSYHTRPKIWTLMVAGYGDVFQTDMFSVFLGAGLGTAAVKDKIVQKNPDLSGSSKRKYNFTYQLTVGTAFALAEGTTAELAYRWQDYGKGKKSKSFDIKLPKYKGHNIMAGIRFAI